MDEMFLKQVFHAVQYGETCLNRSYLNKFEIKHPLLLPEEEEPVVSWAVVETVIAPGSSMMPFKAPSASVSGSPSVSVIVIRLSPSLLPNDVSVH